MGTRDQPRPQGLEKRNPLRVTSLLEVGPGSSHTAFVAAETMGCCCCKMKSCCGKVSGEFTSEAFTDLNQVCEELQRDLDEVHRLRRRARHLDLNFSNCKELTDLSALTIT